MNKQVAIVGVVAASLLSGAVVAVGEPKFSGAVIPHRLMAPAAREVRVPPWIQITTSSTPPRPQITTSTTAPPVHSNVVSLSGESAAGPTYGVPTGLTIPAIGLRSPVVPLGKRADGTAEVPSGYDFAGWYDLGPRPGQRGPPSFWGTWTP